MVEYTYDALGRRASRTAGGATTSFVYDGLDVVLDKGQIGGDVDYLNAPSIDMKLRQSSQASGALYFVHDHLGSTVGLTNAGGGLVERLQYEAFGAGGSSSLTRYGFTGREHDDLTGLTYYRARWYDPQQGRFTSEDPIGFAGGLNLYAYTNNSPLNLTDPLGLDPPNGPQPNSNTGTWWTNFRDWAITVSSFVPFRIGAGQGTALPRGGGEAIGVLQVGPDTYNTLGIVGNRNAQYYDALRCAQGDCSPRPNSDPNSPNPSWRDGLGHWTPDGYGSGYNGGQGSGPGFGFNDPPGGNGNGGGTGSGNGSGSGGSGSQGGGGGGDDDGGGGWFDWLWPRRRKPPCP